MGKKSPNYPVCDLTEALERIEKFYKTNNRAPVSREAAVKSLGYKSVSGAALRLMSSLGQYGLLENASKGMVQASSLAMTILHPSSPAEKQEAISRAALSPPLFDLIIEKYRETGIPGDDGLMSELIRNMGYSQDAASVAIRCFRETLKIVKLDNMSNNRSNEQNEAQESHDNSSNFLNSMMANFVKFPNEPANTEMPQSKSDAQQKPWQKIFNFPLSDTITATLAIAGGKPTASDLEVLHDYLKIATKALAKQELAE